MPTTNIGSVRLHYEVSGKPESPWLVLSNSLGTDLTMWAPQLAQFETHFRVLRYDMRGHGESSVPAGSYSIDMLGQDVVDMLNALHIDSCSFCGLSIGGVIAQWLAVHAPERLRKVVLCNTAAKIGTVDGWNDRMDVVRQHGMLAIADGVITRWFTQIFIQNNVGAIATMRQVLTATDPVGYTASCAALRDMDQRELVKSIRLPTLIVCGDADPVTTVQDGQALQESIAGSRLASVPGAHISNVESPGAFATTVLSFLTGAL